MEGLYTFLQVSSFVIAANGRFGDLLLRLLVK